MLAQMIKILLCLMLCLAIVSCDKCRNYQDIAGVEVVTLIYPDKDTHIDSVAMVANNSITGCGDPRYGSMIGSKTHSIKFPVNMNVQLFANGNLLWEFSSEMSKNTILKVYNKFDCLNSSSNSPISFHRRMESAKKSNRYIDSFIDDDFCWLLEKMDSSYDDSRCVEWGAGGETDLYCGPY
jgi:hypothetical protein